MILAILFLIVAGFAKAIKDLCASGGLSKWGKFWDEMYSWKYKWKLDANGNAIIPLEEKFLGSSTVFVNLTSGFHLAQLFEYNALIAGIILLCQHANFWIAFAVASLVLRLTFEISYRALKG